MKLFKTKLLFILLLVFIVNINYAQDSIPLSLSRTIELSVQNNKDIVISNYRTNASEYALKEAKGNFLPKLFLNANYNRNIERQVIFLPAEFGLGSSATKLGYDNDYRGALNFSMPLYSSYNLTNKKFVETRYNLQNELGRGTQQAIVNATKKAYFNYLIASEIVKVQQRRLKNAEETVVDIEKRFKQGTLTNYDLTTAKVQVANAKNSLLEAQSNSLPAANSLKLLIGLSDGDILKLTESIELMLDELSVEESIDEMLGKNSLLKQLKLDIELSDKQIELTKSAYYPTLDAIGNYNYQTQSDDFKVSEYDWVNTSVVGLQFNFNIFNGTITKNKVQQAEINKKIAEEEVLYATTELKMRFNELLTQLDFSKQKVAVQKENMDLTTEALALVKKRYKFGIGTFLEVNDAELSFTQARLGWLQAIATYKAAYYDYQLLIGKEI